jgi:hypothetical protein
MSLYNKAKFFVLVFPKCIKPHCIGRQVFLMHGMLVFRYSRLNVSRLDPKELNPLALKLQRRKVTY